MPLDWLYKHSKQTYVYTYVCVSHQNKMPLDWLYKHSKQTYVYTYVCVSHQYKMPPIDYTSIANLKSEKLNEV